MPGVPSLAAKLTVASGLLQTLGAGPRPWPRRALLSKSESHGENMSCVTPKVVKRQLDAKISRINASH